MRRARYGLPAVVALLAGLAVPALAAAAQTPPATGSAGALPAAPRGPGAPRLVPPPAAPAPQDVSVRTELDRTAVWVADRLTYTVEITCTNGFDLLVDDLSRDRLKLEGLDVVGGDTVRQADSDGAIRYQFRYVLTTYHVDMPTLRISPLTVRYYVRRPGQRLEDTAPAGTLQVPGAVVAFRSLLPDDQASYPIRDNRPAEARPLVFTVLPRVGVGLIILSIAPVAFAALALARRIGRRRGAAGPSHRQARQEARARLESVRAADAATPEARREAFTELDALLRRHLSDVSGVPAPSLTPAEIAAALEPHTPRMPVELVTSVLTACEVARYAPPEHLPPVSAWRDTLAQAEQVLAIGR